MNSNHVLKCMANYYKYVCLQFEFITEMMKVTLTDVTYTKLKLVDSLFIS